MAKQRVVAIIPARYGSTRLPGKPLVDVGGWPMIRHVYHQVSQAQVDQVLVATDDERIVAAVEAFSGQVLLTSCHHPSGSDRVAEAARRLALAPDDLVINVQGDEPFLPAAEIDRVVALLRQERQRLMATLAVPFNTAAEWHNPNMVKVICTIQGDRALYFSRAAIPYCRDGEATAGMGSCWRHVGLYGYRYDFLQQLAQLPPTPLENMEKLEQLRVLEHGFPIHVAIGAAWPGGIDTPEDLRQAQLRMHPSPPNPLSHRWRGGV
ncbi:MAG: 3-deoxy-manno-octulosonate cytidylyltransferase [Magnetococcales bacterium]|nr:3-deoxy-manno-octulosonate cytidylyltransferase [Magnetococcales bacterium]